MLKPSFRSIPAIAFLFIAHLASAQWTRLPDIPMHVRALSFPTDQVGYALGDSLNGGTAFFFTTDGAQTWAPVPLPLSFSGQIQNIHFPAADTGFIAWRPFGHVAMHLSRTWDRGQSWTEVSPDSITFAVGSCGLNFLNADKGGFGVANKLYITSDGGLTWTTSTFRSTNVITDMDFADSDHGIVGIRDDVPADRGGFLTTTNGGMSWDSLYLTASNSAIAKVCTDQPQSGYAIPSHSSGNYLLRTTDNWETPYSIPLQALDTIIYEIPKGLDFKGGWGWICSSQGRILISSDDGLTWTEERAPDFQELNELVIAPTKVYAGGSAGRMLVRDMVTSTDPQSASLPLGAYPNPAAPGDELHFRGLSHRGEQTAVLMDVHGRTVATSTLGADRSSLRIPVAASGMLFLRTSSGASARIMVLR